MLETVVAVVIFTLVGTAVLAALSTAHTSGARTESQSIAENLARNQMEDAFCRAYQEPELDLSVHCAPCRSYGCRQGQEICRL